MFSSAVHTMGAMGASLSSEVQHIGSEIRSEVQHIGSEIRSEVQHLGSEIMSRGSKAKARGIEIGTDIGTEIAEMAEEIAEGNSATLTDKLRSSVGKVKSVSAMSAEMQSEIKSFGNEVADGNKVSVDRWLGWVGLGWVGGEVVQVASVETRRSRTAAAP